jgi:hypothetical protein
VRPSPSILIRVTYFRSDITNAIINNVPIAFPLAGVNGQTGAFEPGNFQRFDGTVVPNYTAEQFSRLQFAKCSNLGTASPIVNGQSTCNVTQLSNINAQSYLTTGWEIAFDWQVAPKLALSATHSIVDSRPIGNVFADTFRDVRTDTDINLLPSGIQGGYFYNYQALDVPFNTTTVGLRYGSPGGFQTALTGQFVGLRPRQFGSNFYQPYVRWDLTFKVPLTEELTMTAGFFNLFSDRSILSEGGVAVGGQVLQPPTTFKVGVEGNF